MRIYLDANVIFSAMKSDGAVRCVVQWLREHGHELVADEYVLEEAQRNILARYPAAKNAWSVSDTVNVSPILKLHDLPDDLVLAEKDRPVLASAKALMCDALVTGDKTHFGHLYGSRIGGVAIHSPRSIAELLLR